MSHDKNGDLDQERIEELKDEFDAEFETDGAIGPESDHVGAEADPAAATHEWFGCTIPCTLDITECVCIQSIDLTACWC